MRDGEYHGVGGTQRLHCHELDAVFVLDLVRIGQRIVHLHREPERLQLVDDVHDFRVARIRHVLLERHAEHRDRRRRLSRA